MGSARVWFTHHKAIDDAVGISRSGFLLDGLWAHHYSTPIVRTVFTDVVGDVTLNFMLEKCKLAVKFRNISRSPLNLRVCDEPGRINKFKLLGITTC
jgi:hypothetical protein